MLRTGLGLGLLAVSIMFSGCRMCRHPYDYCGPVYNGPHGPSSWHSRAGSVLDGTQAMPDYYEEYQPAYTGNPQPTRAVAPQPTRAGDYRPARPDDYQSADSRDYKALLADEAQPDDVPGSMRVLSVTDRVLGEGNAPIETNRIAEDNSSGAPSSAGWTARRPTAAERR
ncbi:MAG: hypothetical protein GX594_13810 [Pirellulaceae bacterium]|nr:hypothetical protein [Pirellulaceae bacterium]